jgi:hypothetical protein
MAEPNGGLWIGVWVGLFLVIVIAAMVILGWWQ